MVPQYIIPIATMPLSRNGKIDLAALPAPFSGSAVKDEGYVAPRTHTEQVVAAVWSTVLGLERLGIHEDFFDLGGDSLAATRIVARLNNTFGCNTTIRAVFDQSTVASFCAAHLSNVTPRTTEGAAWL
jgi:acyl carrier protein